MPTTNNNSTDKSVTSKIIGALLKFVVPFVISVGLCWVLFHDDNLTDMLQVVQTKCDFIWIWLMLLVSFMSYVFRALRWGIQLEGVGIEASKRDLLYSIFGTYAVNLVFPRLGEVWRTGFIAHRENASFGTVFGTMLADRLADFITVITFTIATLLVGHKALTEFIGKYPDSYTRLADIVTSPWTLTALIAVILLAIWFFRRKTRNGYAKKIKEFALGLWLGFSAILKMKHKGRWIIWTLLLWGCYFAQMVLAFQAFPFTREIFTEHGMAAVLICFTLGSIAMGIPSNGGIGPYQIALIFSLALYCPAGLDETATKAFELDSKAFANLILTSSTLLTMLLGLWAFIAIAISRKRPRQAE